MPSRSPVASSFALLRVGQCLAAALACLALSALQLFTACQLTLVAVCGAFVNCGNRLVQCVCKSRAATISCSSIQPCFRSAVSLLVTSIKQGLAHARAAVYEVLGSDLQW